MCNILLCPLLPWEDPQRSPHLSYEGILLLNSRGREGKRGNEDILGLKLNSSPETGNECVVYVETSAWLSSHDTIYQNS